MPLDPSRLRKYIAVTYTLLPPPLSALPAKYHAPISLLAHSLSTGVVSASLAEMVVEEGGWSGGELVRGDVIDTVFAIGLAHDIHQKLVGSGVVTPRRVRGLLEEIIELSNSNFSTEIEVKAVIDSIDNNTCESRRPPRGLPQWIATACMIADMLQGKMGFIDLIAWLENVLMEYSREARIDTGLTVGYYSVMLPQPFARQYISDKIIDKLQESETPIILASPHGIIAIGYEDELPRTIRLSWDELRINKELIPYKLIVELEENPRRKIEKDKILLSKTPSQEELRLRVWSKFARYYYMRELLEGEEPLKPILPENARSLFINIELTDVEYTGKEPDTKCTICGMPHQREASFPPPVYVKIAGAQYKTEKWNRLLMPGRIVRTYVQWRAGIGVCPFCMLDAVAQNITGIRPGGAYQLISIAKPIPVEVLSFFSSLLEGLSDLRRAVQLWRTITRIKDREKNNIDYRVKSADTISQYATSPNPTGTLIDRFTATIGVPAPEPNAENLTRRIGELGLLASLGLYPIKYTYSISPQIPDRLIITPHAFSLVNYSLTKSGFTNVWVAGLLASSWGLEKSKAVELLSFPSEMAELLLLSHEPGEYERISHLIESVTR